MKKIFAFLVIIVAGIGGFLLWKRNQVQVANQVAIDPWPAAVSSATTPQIATETQTVVDATESDESLAKKPIPKKSGSKQSTKKMLPRTRWNQVTLNRRKS